MGSSHEVWNADNESVSCLSLKCKNQTQSFNPLSEGGAADCESFQQRSKEDSNKIVVKRSNVDFQTLEQRENPGPHSPLWSAAFNLFIPLFGTGLLSLPYAIQHGGWISVVAFLVVPIISFYTAVILVDCLYDNNPETAQRVRVRSSYEEIGAVVSPKYGRKVVSIVLVVTMILVSTGFLVLAGSFLDGTFPGVAINKRLWTVIAGVFVLPTIFLKNVPQIGLVSLVGVLANAVPLITTVWYVFQHSNNSEWTISAIKHGDLEGVFISINIITFSYGLHGVLLKIENTIANKSRVYPLLTSCFVFSTFVNCFFSLCCFLSFTNNTKDQITNNLPVGVPLYVANTGIAVKVVFSYALPLFIVVDYFDKNSPVKTFCLKKVSSTAWFVLLRLALFFLTLTVAVFLPHFGLVVAFTSSLGGSALIFLFPTFFHLKLFKQLSLMKRLCDYVVFVLGLFVAVLGAFFSLKGAIYQFKS